MKAEFFRWQSVHGAAFRRYSRLGSFVCLGCLLLLLQIPTWARASEYQLKVEMINNFVLFVDWPKQTFAAPTSPLQICALGEDPVAELLGRELNNRQVNDQPLVYHRPANEEQGRDCHLLFIGRSEEPRLEEILARLEGAPVLTVSDIEGFCTRGGMIELVGDEYKAEFDLNASAANAAGLSIGSGLKRIARTVDCGER